jgi:hypothetical protein
MERTMGASLLHGSSTHHDLPQASPPVRMAVAIPPARPDGRARIANRHDEVHRPLDRVTSRRPGHPGLSSEHVGASRPCAGRGRCPWA